MPRSVQNKPHEVMLGSAKITKKSFKDSPTKLWWAEVLGTTPIQIEGDGRILPSLHELAERDTAVVVSTLCQDEMEGNLYDEAYGPSSPHATSRVVDYVEDPGLQRVMQNIAPVDWDLLHAFRLKNAAEAAAAKSPDSDPNPPHLMTGVTKSGRPSQTNFEKSTRNQQIADRYLNGETVGELAQAFYLCEASIRIILKERGVRGRRQPSHRDKEIAQRYMEGEPAVRLSARYDIPVNLIYRLLRRLEVPLHRVAPSEPEPPPPPEWKQPEPEVEQLAMEFPPHVVATVILGGYEYPLTKTPQKPRRRRKKEDAQWQQMTRQEWSLRRAMRRREAG